jgi:hypothetical protein
MPKGAVDIRSRIKIGGLTEGYPDGFPPGGVYSVPAENAKRLVALGYADYVGDEPGRPYETDPAVLDELNKEFQVRNRNPENDEKPGTGPIVSPYRKLSKFAREGWGA